MDDDRRMFVLIEFDCNNRNYISLTAVHVP